MQKKKSVPLPSNNKSSNRRHGQSPVLLSYCLLTIIHFIDTASVDDWMDRQIKKAGQRLPAPQATPQEDPVAELERFFADPLVSRDECVDLIAWWGVSILLGTY